MYILSFTPAQIASTVWSSTSRTLTNSYGTLIMPLSNFKLSIAANSSLILDHSGSTVYDITFGTQVSSTGNLGIGLYNGTTSQVFANPIANAFWSQRLNWNQFVYPIFVNNDGANPQLLTYTGWYMI